MIHFITHYQTLSSTEKEKILTITDTFSDFSPFLLMNLMMMSARKFHPGCKITLLTNEKSDIEGLCEEVEIVRYPFDKFGNRIAEMLSIQRYLAENPYNPNTLIVDFDILFQSAITSLFDAHFDLFFVRRETGGTKFPPVNMGVVGIKEDCAKSAAKFFQKIVDQILPFPDLCIWGGSQLAIQKLLFHHLHHQNSPNRVHFQGVELYFGNDCYNYSPTQEELNLKKQVIGKKILHFKGELKKQMPLYYNLFIKS